MSALFLGYILGRLKLTYKNNSVGLPINTEQYSIYREWLYKCNRNCSCLSVKPIRVKNSFNDLLSWEQCTINNVDLLVAASVTVQQLLISRAMKTVMQTPRLLVPCLGATMAVFLNCYTG